MDGIGVLDTKIRLADRYS